MRIASGFLVFRLTQARLRKSVKPKILSRCEATPWIVFAAVAITGCRRQSIVFAVVAQAPAIERSV
ncbi:MAG: hypothetical protein ABJM06_14465 [Gilvibacter sp.]|uniref:hypothetical protein n=1 Tax=Ekhidna sp. TaxID=2608089 RepID=UPI003298E512